MARAPLPPGTAGAPVCPLHAIAICSSTEAEPHSGASASVPRSSLVSPRAQVSAGREAMMIAGGARNCRLTPSLVVGRSVASIPSADRRWP